MFWMVYIIQAFALDPYFGPRGELWLGINPPNAYHKTYIPTILVDPQTGGPYFSQLGFNGELVSQSKGKDADRNLKFLK